MAYIRPDQEEWLHSILPGCDFLRWASTGVDIVPSGRDKADGIEAYLSHYGIPLTDYMAFGDEHNDVGMIRRAPIGVAMGNGNEDVKAVADYVTTDIDDNGIWNALKHFGVL